MKKRVLPIIAIFVLLLALMIGGCDDAQPPVERIALSSLPRLEYLKGEPFDLNSAKVVVYYADGRQETIPLTLEMISDYNPQEVRTHILTVRYENASATIRINISNAPVTHVEAVSGALPYKSEYIEEQSLDVENLLLKINYETGDPDFIPVTAEMVE
ncbi:MAG: hypothetical protein GX568_03955, partial [Candidatus Gastranaerophilales bacterium]|nr:hypothetical protein [Candidatus Gastranaerophilales bacterium]